MFHSFQKKTKVFFDNCRTRFQTLCLDSNLALLGEMGTQLRQQTYAQHVSAKFCSKALTRIGKVFTSPLLSGDQLETALHFANCLLPGLYRQPAAKEQDVLNTVVWTLMQGMIQGRNQETIQRLALFWTTDMPESLFVARLLRLFKDRAPSIQATLAHFTLDNFGHLSIPSRPVFAETKEWQQFETHLNQKILLEALLDTVSWRKDKPNDALIEKIGGLLGPFLKNETGAPLKKPVDAEGILETLHGFLAKTRGLSTPSCKTDLYGMVLKAGIDFAERLYATPTVRAQALPFARTLLQAAAPQKRWMNPVYMGLQRAFRRAKAQKKPISGFPASDLFQEIVSSLMHARDDSALFQNGVRLPDGAVLVARRLNNAEGGIAHLPAQGKPRYLLHGLAHAFPLSRSSESRAFLAHLKQAGAQALRRREDLPSLAATLLHTPLRARPGCGTC